MEIEDLFNPSIPGGGQPSKPSGPLVSLKKDLDFYMEAMLEVAQTILREDLSEYPIFIAHQHEAAIGELILDKSELTTNWSIHASTLEEFVERGIILEERKKHFIQNFKDPNEFMCLFVMVPQGANFVFYPYRSEVDNANKKER